jgi:polysaccharide export outer membrane protein
MKTKAFAAFAIAFLAPAIAAAGDYVIGEGDVLYVSVWGEETLNLPVKVRPDGKITVPAIGDVAAAGSQPVELQKALGAKLMGIIKNPVVTVLVQEITNNKVYVFGGGIKSGVINLVRRTTLLQLLCQIENIDSADLKEAYVLRGGERVKTGFHELFMNGAISEDMPIEPNDVIFIPPVLDKNVYVVGAVIRPRSIPFREGMTVMEAILESGGFTKFARESSTVIHRNGPVEAETIRVDVKKVMEDGELSQNVKLRPGDYIVVKEGLF